MSELIAIPEEVISYIYLILYVFIIGLILTVIYSFIEWFSKDRVIKLIEGRRVTVFIGNEAIHGRLVAPSKSGGAFEIFYEPNKIENPVSLLAFLVENYKETGERKFLREAETLVKDFKSRGLLPRNFTLKDVVINPWYPASVVSRKVFAEDLNNLYAILMFRHMMTERELKHKWRELKNLYHPSIHHRIKRKIYNAVSFARDKLASMTAGVPLPYLSLLPSDVQKAIKDAQKQAILIIGSNYNPLLEDSIGRLVTVQVQDIDGEIKLYQGVLKEYSSKYIMVYDVDYRIQMITVFKGDKELEGYPKPIFEQHGFIIGSDKHLKILNTASSGNEYRLTLSNISKEPVKVEKLVLSDKEVQVNKVLFPGEQVEASFNIEGNVPSEPEVKVYYEICREADIVWPLSKAKVIGSGDYPAELLEGILR